MTTTEKQDHRVLLVDADGEHSRVTARVLSTAVKHLDVCASVAELSKFDPGASPYDLIVINHDGLAIGECSALLERFGEACRRGRLLLFVSAEHRQSIADLFGHHGLTNILARNAEPLNEELLVTIQKILKRDIFGIGKYFSWGSQSKEIVVKSSSERDDAVNQVREFALSVGAKSRFADLLCTAADELITNAVYNAPTDNSGAPRHASVSRNVEVTLLPDEAVCVTLCSDGRRVGISVADGFGSIEVPTILKYLAKCLRRGTDQVDEKAGGAGLGLFYVFDALGHFIVNLEAGVKTEMIGILDLQARYKDFSERPKSFNVFVRGKP